MGRNLVCSDLHGCGKLWDDIKEFLKPEDTLFILGDSGDRGSESWRVLKESVLHPQTKYILGNHDVMLLDTILWHESEMLWFRNGGHVTWEQMKQDPERNKVLNALKKCPYHIVYTNDKHSIYLNHSGCISDNFDLEVWDRKHYLINKDIEDYDYVIHGHTPIDIMIHDFNFAPSIDFKWEYGHSCHYQNGQKINIDCGAYWEGFIILIDLDTFEEHVIGKVQKERAW